MKIQSKSLSYFLKKHISFLLIIFSVFLFSGTLTSCRGNKPSDQASEQEAGKKKKKPKKCKDEGCKVRMSHYHEGSPYKGKRGNFFIRLFTPKESKYGQGRHRNHGWKKGKK
ncbi:hypothetical protein ACE193_08610 [Bernardetia sp. OM2101]|uniref:hypothetical protein n=1 Tax=Bernardetia sp. OM2101 TaxID=3344876 RepID=UPI0035CF4AAC